MTSTHKNILVSVMILAACAIVYSQTYGFDFINIDDRAYIWENPAVQSGLNSQSVLWAFKSFHAANWHPLTWLSHMLDAQMFGPWAGGHHITNVVLHTINSLLVFFLLRYMAGSTWKSAMVALLFAVHPAHVESVAWIAERKDVLSTMFWLLTMIVYVRCTRNSGGSDPDPPSSKFSSWLGMWPVVILFALGLMAKPMLVTLPFVLLLCDYWPLGRLKDRRDFSRLVLEKVPLFALAIASSIVTVFAQGSGGAVATLTVVPLPVRSGNVVISFARYIRMLVYPIDLGFWYPLDPAINPIFLISSAILLLVITAFVWRFRTAHEYLLMGWLWFLGTLVPVIGIIQVGLQSHADRYTYIPSIGLFIMIVWGLASLLSRWPAGRTVAFAAAAIVLVALTVAAYRQTSLWQNSEKLYTHTLALTQNNYLLMSNLCLYYLQKSNVVTADQKCTELLGPMPPSGDSLQILGFLKTETGKYDEGVRLLTEAARLDPTSAEIRLHLSQALARQGNAAEAEEAAQSGLKMNDTRVRKEVVARTALALGDSFMKSGRRDKAIEYYQNALSLKPDLTEARTNLQKLGVK